MRQSGCCLGFYFIIVILAASGCGNFPKDSEGTLEKARNHVLKVGLTSCDPKADVRTEPVGDQIRFVKQFAGDIHAKVMWVRGSHGDITALLSHHELHMAIGGYTPDSPYKKEVTLSKPYYSEKVYIGARGRTVPSTLTGEHILVHDALTAYYVRKKKGIPVPAKNFNIPGGHLMAAAESELESLGVTQRGKVLHELRYVIAVPMGESAFLIALEKFIDRYETSPERRSLRPR